MAVGNMYVPKKNLIVLASLMKEPHYIETINNENDPHHDAICRIEENEGI